MHKHNAKIDPSAELGSVLAFITARDSLGQLRLRSHLFALLNV